MNFGTLFKTAFADPKPDYAFTRAKIVWAVNQYVLGTLTSNLGRKQFGFSGTIEFPPAAPAPYVVPPNTGARCGAILTFVPGAVLPEEYDACAKLSQAAVGAFWEQLFYLTGLAITRSIVTIAPLIPAPDEAAPDQTSTPYPYDLNTMCANGSFYLTLGNVLTPKRVLDDWKSAGKRFFEKIDPLKLTDPDTLYSHLGQAVRDAATRNGFLWRHYQGSIKIQGNPEPGIAEGYIYGSMKYD
jgi:hypothetical protein